MRWWTVMTQYVIFTESRGQVFGLAAAHRTIELGDKDRGVFTEEKIQCARAMRVYGMVPTLADASETWNLTLEDQGGKQE